MTTKTIMKLMAIVALMIAAAAFASACTGSADEDTGPTDDPAEHVDDPIDADGSGDDIIDDQGDDTDPDMDPDMDMDSDDDADATARLEAEPKDALFLVDMSLFSFSPDIMEVKVGDVVEIAIQNSEAALHDFTIDKIDADVHISYLGGTGQHEHEEPANPADVHFALTEPGSGVVHLKINEPGEYVFYCSVPGHQDLGMEGTLIVTEA